MEHESKEDKVRAIYESLDANERVGVRFGLFPYRIAAVMKDYGVTASDLMAFDERVRLADRQL